MVMPQVCASDRFAKAYKRATFCLQGLAVGAVRDFGNRYNADRPSVLRNYDRHALLPDQVIEIDISGGHRMLASLKRERLILLDMGGHEIVGRYDSSKLRTDLLNHTPAPESFHIDNSSELFIKNPGGTNPAYYQEEISSDWLYFLEDEQVAILEDIEYSIIEAGGTSHLIMGGPGTGKTSILVNLFHDLVDWGLRVGILFSDSLQSYLESSTSFPFSEFNVKGKRRSGLDVVLVDDPTSLRLALNRGERDSHVSIVVAFDPLQLPEDLTDRSLRSIEREYKTQRHVLKTCYRQKETVGETTKRVVDTIADSTPFLVEDRINRFRSDRNEITLISNELTFLNPSGYTQYYVDATTANLTAEISRVLEQRWAMWRHWPGLMVLVEGSELPAAAEKLLSPLAEEGYVHTVFGLDNIESVKGLEFQHVFIFIRNYTFNEIQNGFTGSGQAAYHRRRLLRIPFSRAKDSIVTFSMGEDWELTE